VVTDAMEPITGVAIIGFAAVEDAMDKGGVGIGQVLDQGVGGFVVIVPEEDEGFEAVGAGGWKLEGAGQDVGLVRNRVGGEGAGAGLGTEVGRFGSGEQFVEGGAGIHGGGREGKDGS
jgi:hypothetical protein